MAIDFEKYRVSFMYKGLPIKLSKDNNFDDWGPETYDSIPEVTVVTDDGNVMFRSLIQAKRFIKLAEKAREKESTWKLKYKLYFDYKVAKWDEWILYEGSNKILLTSHSLDLIMSVRNNVINKIVTGAHLKLKAEQKYGNFKRRSREWMNY